MVGLWANPSDPSVVAGEAVFSSQGGTLQVNTSDRAIINWKDFSIKPGETTRFIQPSKTSAVLNRVTGGELSSIQGALQASGRVYLVNPHGVIVGPSGVITAAGFFASTLDVCNDDFLNQRDLLFSGDSKAQIANYGTIRVESGNVALLGYKIDNYGSIQAPEGTVSLGAGQEILLKPENDDVAFIRPKLGGELTQAGKVEAIKVELLADGNPYLLAINHPGKTEAIKVSRSGGRVQLIAKGGNIDVEGEVAAFGGDIDVQGQNIVIGKASKIDVSGMEGGSGGRAVLIAENAIGFYGAIAAEGSSSGGDGGFVEVSGHQAFAFRGRVSTLAPFGSAGMLVIDPGDVTIGNFGGAGSSNPLFVPPTYNPVVAPGNLDIVDLTTALGLGNVAVLTTAGGFGVGNITIAADFSWASNHNLTLTANQNIILNARASCTAGGGFSMTAGGDVRVGSAGSLVPTSIETNTGAISISAVGNLLITAGMTALPIPASALIRSESGAITVVTANNVLITGGTDTDCFAEISSRLNNLTFTNVASHVELTAGSRAGTYAQIGRGSVPGGTAAVQSNINFQAIGGHILLQGGTSPLSVGAYAQIGHSPFGPAVAAAITVSGDLLFGHPVLGNGGFVHLIGGTATEASAIIGHGNELSTFMSSASGTIRVKSQNFVTLDAGSGTHNDAVIGFYNPAAGTATGTFTVTSPEVTVTALLANDLTLNAADGSNAIIGYYNATNPIASLSNVVITTINAGSFFSNPTILQAGNAATAGTGVAVIGTFANMGTVQSNIVVATGAVDLRGPAVGDNGLARILNNTPGVSVPAGDITFNILIGMGGVSVLGGLGTGFSDIYSSRNLTINCPGSIVVNNVTQTGYAQVSGFSNVFINPPNPGILGTNILVVGGAFAGSTIPPLPPSYALIQCYNGPIVLGDPTSPTFGVATNIVVGDPAGNSMAPSQIYAESGNSLLAASGDITITGGPVASQSYATIGGNSTNMTVSGRSLTLQGGTNTSCFAEFSSISGDLLFNLQDNASVSIVVQGGSGMQAYAQIGKGLNIGTPPPVVPPAPAPPSLASVTGSITFHTMTGSAALTGGSNVGAYAQIGHAPTQPALTPITVGGDVIFAGAGIFGPLTLTGGSATNTTAIIGHGNELTSTIGPCSGDIFVRSNVFNITLQAGSVPQTAAIIGYANPTGGSLAGIVFNVNAANGVSVIGSNCPITLNATDMNNATIGYYNGSNISSTATISVPTIAVQTGGANDITLNSGNTGLPPNAAGIASIGTYTNAGTAASNINIQCVGGTLFLNGPTTPNDNGAARILNTSPGMSTPNGSNISIQANDVQLLGGTVPFPPTPPPPVPPPPPYGFVDIYSGQDVTIQFTDTLTVNNPLQTGYAHIVGFSDVLINSSGGGNLATIVGGLRPFVSFADPGSDALIESLNGQQILGGIGGGVGNVFIGDATSLAPSWVIANMDQNVVSSTNDVTLQAGAAPFAVAFVQNTSGNITVTAGNNVNITGGTGGDNAPAEILNDSGNIDISANNLFLTGGGNAGASNDLCFAQISSNTGQITLDNIQFDVVLTGGFGPRNYAQIGKGANPGPLEPAQVPVITAGITFAAIGGDVILQGQTGANITGANSYTQIGHSPFDPAAGLTNFDVINAFIVMPGVAGGIFLNGANNTNNTAIIGHGNEVSNFLQSVQNSLINIQDLGASGINLMPGTVPTTHAVIGFHNPTAGTVPSFSVDSPQLIVAATGGPVVLTATLDNNAIIGYYNPTTATPSMVSIEDLEVQTDPLLGSVTLQADSVGANLGGNAVIGTQVAVAGGGNISQSNIVITTATLNLMCDIGAGAGNALVVNNQFGVSTIGANDYDISLNLLTGNILGENGGTLGVAEVYSSRFLNLEFQTAFNINFDPANPATLQTRSAIVNAFSDILINQTTPKPETLGDLTIIGTNSPLLLSQLISTSGNVVAGTSTANEGVDNITIGSAAMLGAAQILAPAGQILIYGIGDATVHGGAGAGATGEISAQNDVQLVFDSPGPDGHINVFGGSAASGQIVTAAGNLYVEAGSDINIQGTATNTALVYNSGGGGGTVLIHADHNINMGLNSFLLNSSPGSLTAIADVDINLLQNALVLTTTGDLTLVVDNAYPTPPGIGTGRIVKQAGATIFSLSGAVRIFTARQSLNQIVGNINGILFVPGTLFLDTNIERWLTYYPNGFGGFPFTIFYKDPDSLPGFVENIGGFPFSEFFYDLSFYDQFLFHPISECFSYDRKMYAEALQGEGSVSSHELYRDRCYVVLRKLYRNYHTKKIDLLK